MSILIDCPALVPATETARRSPTPVAEVPDFAARRLTNYTSDDGQELTSISISNDGRHVVYVRGGDHDRQWQLVLDP